jgi:4-carboxymuconolactone decarboxylase
MSSNQEAGMHRPVFTIIMIALTAVSAFDARAESNGKECVLTDDRYERGLQRLDELSQGMGQAVVESMSKTSPDFARYLVEYPYGDVFCRAGLDDKQRELSTIAALAALGYAEPELRVHINSALNAGASREEVTETMILMSVYAGFPAAIHGLRAAEAVFEARDDGSIEED